MKILEFGPEATVRYIRRVSDDSDKQTRRMAEAYRERLCLKPSAKERMKLMEKDSVMDPEVQAAELADFYRSEMRRIEKKRAKLFTGYGQCEGFLITDGRNILVACCPPMAEQVISGGAHMHKGNLYISDRADEHSVGPDGTVSIIKGEKPLRTTFCPFCFQQELRFVPDGASDGRK